MKKLLLILFVLFSIGVNAQTESHLEFKGIPITGSVDNVMNKLKTQGYVLVDSNDEIAIVKGQFANEECEIIIAATPKSKQVYMVLVCFEEKESWWTLKSDYKKLKEQITAKYNVKPKSTERFIDPYYEGDGYELQALRKDKCRYHCEFKLTNGKIDILLSDEASVYLYYTDAIGEKLNEQEENQSSYDDL